MTQFQPAELPGHHPGWCVGDKRGHPQPVGVGEPQLRSRMWAFLAQDEPGPDGPAAQIDQIGGLGDPGTLAMPPPSSIAGDQVSVVLRISTAACTRASTA